MAQDLANDGDVLRLYLFEGDLIQLPRPDDDLDGFLPQSLTGSLPALLYPPLSEQGIEPGAQINLEITPYHIYFGALRELAESADEERAEILRTSILSWNPNAALELCEMAQPFFDTDLETALLHFELALELDENLYEALQNAGTCELALAADDEEGPGERLETARDLFERAIAARPENGLSWITLAQVLHQQGDSDGGKETLIEFLETYPEGENRELVQQMLQVALEEPSVPDGPSPEETAAFNEARELAWGQDPARAVELLEPLAAAHPDEMQVWFLLGAAQRRVGNLAEAERCLRRTVRRAPQESFAWSELAQTYLEEQRWKEAREAIERTVQLDPDNPLHILHQAQILEGAGETEEACEAIEKAYALVPDDPSIVETRNRILAALGRA